MLQHPPLVASFPFPLLKHAPQQKHHPARTRLSLQHTAARNRPNAPAILARVAGNAGSGASSVTGTPSAINAAAISNATGQPITPAAPITAEVVISSAMR